VVALNQDFHVQGVVLSIPEDTNGEFYGGMVVLTLKDKATQPSSAMWHATYLAAIVGASNSANDIKSNMPIFAVVTDGGPDHRLTYVSVK